MVSPSYDCKRTFDAGLPFPYENGMLGALKTLYRANSEQLSKVLDEERVLKCRSVAEFHKLVYYEPNGYENADAYWVCVLHHIIMMRLQGEALAV